MRFPFPDFVPVPGAETMRLISLVSLTAGICLVCGTGPFLFLRREKEQSRFPWMLLGVGALLIVNHGLQLLF